jgi:hypothetical protein
MSTFVSETVGDSDTCLIDCPSLSHLVRYDGQGRYIQCDIAGIIMCDIALNIANVNSA